MLNEIQKSWVSALRSGKYAQGKGYLRSPENSFCCLGVLCELAAEAGVIDSPNLAERSYTYQGLRCALPDKVTNWAGLRSSVLGEMKDLSCYDLMVLNDKGKTFAEISDFIESEPSQLFPETAAK